MVTAGVNIKNLFGGMILTLLISVFVMTLSCLLGYVVAKVSLKLKHKKHDYGIGIAYIYRWLLFRIFQGSEYDYRPAYQFGCVW